MTYNSKSRQIRVNTLLNGKIVIFVLDENNVDEENKIVRNKEGTKRGITSVKINAK